MRTILFLAIASLSALLSVTSNAATVSCGDSDSSITLTTSIAGVCHDTGNGNSLNGVNDPVNLAGWLTLDTTLIAGVVPLTFSGTTSGAFSFTPNSLYEHYLIGFQTDTPNPKPDWFVIALAETITSGTWQLLAGTSPVTRAILYGQVAEVVVAPVPLPAALVLFGSALAGFLGFSRLRQRFSRPAVA
jgi:hypothetical protein